MMRSLTIALVAVLCCGATPLAAQASAARLRILGDTNPDLMPPSCRVHGGSPPIPSSPPEWAQSAHPDRRLDSLNVGQLLIDLSAAPKSDPVTIAAASLDTAPNHAAVANYIREGWIHLQAAAGRYMLRVRTIPVTAFLDSVVVRRGYADTLRLRLGHPWYCGL
jgi:hypothetical protein